MMRTTARRAGILSALAVMIAAGAIGCGTSDIVVHDPYASTGSGGSGGAGGASSATGPACPGQCVPIVPLSTPVVLSLLWLGPVGTEPPPCPSLAPVAVDEGHADLTATAPVCSACACDPPQGSCVLPQTMTASNVSCGMPGGVPTMFDPPAVWDGSCDTTNAIPANKLCGGVPCAKSLTIAPLTLVEQGCGVSNPPPADISPPTWATAARSCVGSSQYQGGCGLSEVCAPIADEGEVEGFKLCFAREGEQECPAPWVEMHTVYKSFEDNRMCGACSCGAPVGSTCTAQVSAYSNVACSTGMGPFATNPIDATQAECFDIPPGMGLLSKSATLPVYAAGVCAPIGGEASGEAVPGEPTTFCCLQ